MATNLKHRKLEDNKRNKKNKTPKVIKTPTKKICSLFNKRRSGLEAAEAKSSNVNDEEEAISNLPKSLQPKSKVTDSSCRSNSSQPYRNTAADSEDLSSESGQSEILYSDLPPQPKSSNLSSWRSLSFLNKTEKKFKSFRNKLSTIFDRENEPSLSKSVSTSALNDLDTLCNDFGNLNLTITEKTEDSSSKDYCTNKSGNRVLNILKNLGKSESEQVSGNSALSEAGKIITTPSTIRKFVSKATVSTIEENGEDEESIVFALPYPPVTALKRTNSASMSELVETQRVAPQVSRCQSCSNLVPRRSRIGVQVFSTTPSCPRLPPDSGMASLENITEPVNEQPILYIHEPAEASEILDIRGELHHVKMPQGLVETTDSFYKRMHNRSYPMVHKHRGRALVIAYTGGRNGWQNDVLQLKILFLYLRIEPEFHFDEPKSEVLRLLNTFAQSRENESVDIAFVVIMGHGGQYKYREYLQSADGKMVFLREELEKIFSNERAPYLQDKPKVIVLQMCRDVPSQTHTNSGSDCVTYSRSCSYTFKDYILAYAAQPGRQAMRNNLEGSWYIQDFVSVFLEKSHVDSVLEMLIQVNNKVSSRLGSDQTSEPAFNLTRNLYLFPGIWTIKQKRALKKLLSRKNRS